MAIFELVRRSVVCPRVHKLEECRGAMPVVVGIELVLIHYCTCYGQCQFTAVTHSLCTNSSAALSVADNCRIPFCYPECHQETEINPLTTRINCFALQKL